MRVLVALALLVPIVSAVAVYLRRRRDRALLAARPYVPDWVYRDSLTEDLMGEALGYRQTTGGRSWLTFR